MFNVIQVPFNASAVVRHNSFVPPSQLALLISWWNRSHCSSRTSPLLYENLSRWLWKKWTLILTLAPMSRKLFNRYSTNYFCQRRFSPRHQMMSKARNSKLFIELNNSSSLLSFLMLRWNHFRDVDHIEWNRCIQYDVFSWNFFLTLKTKALNVLGFLS